MYTIKFKDGNTKEFETLIGVNLQGANLRGVDLRGADLQDVDLRYANLRGANLRSTNLRCVNSQDADLRGADLWRANLWDADLRGADLQGADLRRANLRGANFEACKFGYTKGIITANFGKHTAVAWEEGMNIGCKSYRYNVWLNLGFKEYLGKENDYSDEEIRDYEAFIQFAANKFMGASNEK